MAAYEQDIKEALARRERRFAEVRKRLEAYGQSAGERDRILGEPMIALRGSLFSIFEFHIF
jgi:hypothetical protein